VDNPRTPRNPENTGSVAAVSLRWKTNRRTRFRVAGGPGRATLTNNEGTTGWSYPSRKYTLRIQLLGITEKDSVIEVVVGQTVVLNYRLTKENIQSLQEVRVVRNSNKFSKKESIYISRLL